MSGKPYEAPKTCKNPKEHEAELKKKEADEIRRLKVKAINDNVREKKAQSQRN